ncbi:hypothetical protein EYC84_002899 [Monilinia fructicola]|uniref:Uncharacterized protein n=1 Tax=Monilinia fructicola TaxID=38448 RepID=A0A5M9JUZ4_MONFR|nr:hypothetical protein EYC84_002899 [Monilinia fructicola]
MAENTPQYRVFRLPLTPYVVWNREHPGLDQPSDERQYPSYPAHAPGNVMMRFCIRDRKWKPKSDFPQDPARPGQILRSKRGEPIKFCTRCADYFDQRALAKKKKKKPAVRKPADLSELRKKLQVADAAAGLLNRRLERNRQQRQRLNRQAGENSEMRRLLLANIARLEGEGDPPKEEDDDKQVAGGGRDNHDAGEHVGLSNIHASGGYHTRQETNDDYFSAPLAIAAPALIRQNTYSDAPNHTYPPPPPTTKPTLTPRPMTPIPQNPLEIRPPTNNNQPCYPSNTAPTDP